MVDSKKGITNLHASNNIIIDASIPPVIRDGGKCGIKMGITRVCAVIPDRNLCKMFSGNN